MKREGPVNFDGVPYDATKKLEPLGSNAERFAAYKAALVAFIRPKATAVPADQIPALVDHAIRYLSRSAFGDAYVNFFPVINAINMRDGIQRTVRPEGTTTPMTFRVEADGTLHASVIQRYKTEVDDGNGGMFLLGTFVFDTRVKIPRNARVTMHNTITFQIAPGAELDDATGIPRKRRPPPPQRRGFFSGLFG